MAVQIDSNFNQFVVFAEDSVLFALSKITANQTPDFRGLGKRDPSRRSDRR